MKIDILPHRFEAASLPLPVYTSRVPAGFPSPADDYIEDWLDLNQHLIKHPSATFLAYASGQSMVQAGILDRAILVVDRALGRLRPLSWPWEVGWATAAGLPGEEGPDSAGKGDG